MPSYWTSKEERQYKAIKRSCARAKRCRTKKCAKTCTRIAAATVNKRRSK